MFFYFLSLTARDAPQRKTQVKLLFSEELNVFASCRRRHRRYSITERNENRKTPKLHKNPGVNIGENSVIGAGSVVTKDIPYGVVAVGNPCKPIREITEEDKPYYYKSRRFDDEAWKEVQRIISESDK